MLGTETGTIVIPVPSFGMHIPTMFDLCQAHKTGDLLVGNEFESARNPALTTIRNAIIWVWEIALSSSESLN